MPTPLTPATRIRAWARLAFASSAQFFSSDMILSSRLSDDGVISLSHSTGKQILASANSSVPTMGTVKVAPSSLTVTSPLSGPCAQARTLPDSPSGAGSVTVQTTSLDETSQPSETNFQYSSPVSAHADVTPEILYLTRNTATESSWFEKSLISRAPPSISYVW